MDTPTMYVEKFSSDFELGRDGVDVLFRMVDAHDYLRGAPSLEERINRLITIVGKISDAAGIDLLEIVGPVKNISKRD